MHLNYLAWLQPPCGWSYVDHPVTRPTDSTADLKRTPPSMVDHTSTHISAPKQRKQTPDENPHTTPAPFTNPVAINNPFHDKITFNYFSLLLCNLSSDNDTISQIFRLSGHMWQINLKLKPKPTQPTYNYTSYFLYFILPYCRRNTLRARRPFLRRISDFLQTNRN